MEIEPVAAVELVVAHAIFDALRKSDSSAYMSGEPGSKRTLVDGAFNLEAVAKMVLWDLRDVLRPL